MQRMLAHDLIVLSLRDNKRTNRTQVAFGVAGAVLADLALAERIDLVDKKVLILNSAPTGSPLLDDVLNRIAADKPRRAQRWVEKLRGELTRRVLDELVAGGVLQRQDSRFLGVFHVQHFAELDGRATARLVDQLRGLLDEPRPTAPDPRLVVLAGLVRVVGLGKRVFPGVSARTLKTTLTELGDNAWPSEAVRKAIEAATTVVAVAAVAGATASSG